MGSIDTINGRLRSSSSESALPKRIALILGKIVERLEAKAQKRRSRRALLEMTDEQLKDIGISRADAYREAVRPFWD